MPIITSLYRYPVKGLSPEPLDQVELIAGDGFPLDRCLAITNGGWAFDEASYQPQSKTAFLMLMRHEALAELHTRIEQEGQRLVVRAPDGQQMVADLGDAASLAGFSRFLMQFLPDDLPGVPQLVRSTRFRFTDIARRSAEDMRAISVINLASVRALEEAVGRPVDPLRFRANIYFDSDTPWIEHDWIDRELALGAQVRGRVMRRIARCPATQVDPVTAARDMDVPALLREHFGHVDLGVYVTLTAGGRIAPGDAVSV